MKPAIFLESDTASAGVPEDASTEPQRASVLTLLYWRAPDRGFYGQMAGTRLQMRCDSLDELARKAEELHRALAGDDRRCGLALVPCAPPGAPQG